MTPFTPAPWSSRRLINSNGVPYSTLYEAHIAIEPDVCCVWAPPGNAEQEANARLIAAAPEMFAIIRELAEQGTAMTGAQFQWAMERCRNIKKYVTNGGES